jgi:hypothetical protein
MPRQHRFGACQILFLKDYSSSERYNLASAHLEPRYFSATIRR